MLSEEAMADDEKDIDIETDGEDFVYVNGGQVRVSKRYHHNELERKRRDHIKDSFSLLRDVIPAVAGEKQISRAFILNKASEFIKEMKVKNQQHEEEIEALRKSNFILEEQGIKVLQKSRLSGSTESAEKILQSLSGQINERMKTFDSAQPTWEEKTAQIASRLQNSIFTQNLTVKSAQNFMDKFVNKQNLPGVSNSASSPSASLVESSSYYTASDLPAISDQTTPGLTCLQADLSTSGANGKPMASLAGKVLASPIVTSGGNVVTRMPRGVVTATPVSTQVNNSLSSTQQNAVNPTAINLANALKALAAAQSLRVQQQKATTATATGTGSADAVTTTAADIEEEKDIAVSTENTIISDAFTATAKPIPDAAEMEQYGGVSDPIPESTDKYDQQIANTSEFCDTSPSDLNSSTERSADYLSDSSSPSSNPINLNAILGTNLSPDVERLLSTLIHSLQTQSTSTATNSSGDDSTGGANTAATQLTANATAGIFGSSLTSSLRTIVSSATAGGQQQQGATQYAPFPSSGTCPPATTRQLASDDASAGIFADNGMSNGDVIMGDTTSSVGVPLSPDDIGRLCTLDSTDDDDDDFDDDDDDDDFDDDDELDGKHALELSDSLLSLSEHSIKRPRLDTDF